MNDRIAPATKSTIECCFKNIVERQMQIVTISETAFIRFPATVCFNVLLCTRQIWAEIVANT